MQKIIVDNKFDNKKISDVLYFYFNGLTKNTLYKAFRKKDIRINNVRINADAIVHADDEITIYIVDDLLYKNINIPKVYEDENILVVNKPADIEVVGNNSLTTLLEKEYGYIKPCHRLDRNTTGLVLFAKNKVALDILLDKFKKHEIEKHYLARVYGIPNFTRLRSTANSSYNNLNPNANTKFSRAKHKISDRIALRLPKTISEEIKLTAYLFKDNKKSMVYISDIPKKGYVKIETSFTLLEKNLKENYSILDVQLHTGKTHQIRAHLAHLGFPIIGDGKYGINEVNKMFGCKTQQLCSYMLKFNFKTDAGILNYLNGKEIQYLFTF